MPAPAPVIVPPDPSSIKNPDTLIFATKKVRISQSPNQSIYMPPLTPLLTIDTPSPRSVPPPRMTPQPRVDSPKKPVAHYNRSRQPISALVASILTYPYKLLEKWAFSKVLHPTQSLAIHDTDSGKSPEHLQLRRQPRLVPPRNTYYANELGRIFQGIRTRPKKNTHRIKVTDKFNAINYDDIPKELRKEITYYKFVCTFRTKKQDLDRICITIGGNRIKYTGDVGTKTTSLDLFKIVINSILSRKDANYVISNIINVYLQTPLERPEYVHINIRYIPQELIDE